MPFKPGQSGNPAGRKPGVRDKRLVARAAYAAEISARLGFTVDGRPLDAHGLLCAVYAEPALPIELRVDAAKAALKVEKPVLQASSITGSIEHVVSVADALARARRRLTIEAASAFSGPHADTEILQDA